jgi:hypothetical protein
LRIGTADATDEGAASDEGEAGDAQKPGDTPINEPTVSMTPAIAEAFFEIRDNERGNQPKTPANLLP